MAERLADVEARRESVEALCDIVDAVRALASARLQHALASLGGTRIYADMVGEALARAAALAADTPALPPPGRARPVVVLFAPEHGFVGGFAERLVEAAVPAGTAAVPELFAIGSRGAALARERAVEIAWSGTMATRPEGVPATARRVADALSRRYAAGLPARVEAVFGRHRAGGTPTVERAVLLPLDLDAVRERAQGPRPLSNLAAGRLVERLAREYLFARLAGAAMESFAAENAARLAVMASARQNIAGKLEELRGSERRLRQEQITDELLELATAREAIAG